MAASWLLKSWAMPPASTPRASSRAAFSNSPWARRSVVMSVITPTKPATSPMAPVKVALLKMTLRTTPSLPWTIHS